MDREPRWVDRLSDEDLAFLKRFLLASGTLKDLAEQYGISYPTVRLRLDRLIEKVKLIEEQAGAGPFELTLRELYAEGRLDDRTFGHLLRTYQEEEHRDTREQAR
ncbi:MAG TPA: DUF2089 family protein [Actinomycetota bacterium]|nr:DUF2089 family protein [Actinomycetota bacterium]